MAHCYSKLYNIPSTGLRFFTVYGPAGRPDMAYFGFTDKLLRGQTIQIYNYGNCRRDFTYVDDIVEGIVRVMARAPQKRTGPDGLPVPPYAVYNIGGGQPENLLDFVQTLQEELLRAGVLPADISATADYARIPAAQRLCGKQYALLGIFSHTCAKPLVDDDGAITYKELGLGVVWYGELIPEICRDGVEYEQI